MKQIRMRHRVVCEWDSEKFVKGDEGWTDDDDDG